MPAARSATRFERPVLQASCDSASTASDSMTPSMTRSMWSIALTTSASERRRRSTRHRPSATCSACLASSSSKGCGLSASSSTPARRPPSSIGAQSCRCSEPGKPACRSTPVPSATSRVTIRWLPTHSSSAVSAGGAPRQRVSTERSWLSPTPSPRIAASSTCPASGSARNAQAIRLPVRSPASSSACARISVSVSEWARCVRSRTPKVQRWSRAARWATRLRLETSRTVTTRTPSRPSTIAAAVSTSNTDPSGRRHWQSRTSWPPLPIAALRTVASPSFATSNSRSELEATWSASSPANRRNAAFAYCSRPSLSARQVASGDSCSASACSAACW